MKRKSNERTREKRIEEKRREKETLGIYDGHATYVSTHYRPYGIKEAAFTTAVYSVENLIDVYISILGIILLARFMGKRECHRVTCRDAFHLVS